MDLFFSLYLFLFQLSFFGTKSFPILVIVGCFAGYVVLYSTTLLASCTRFSMYYSEGFAEIDADL